MAIKRVYAHEDVYRPLVAALVELARGVKVSDGFDPDAELGPINNRRQFDRVVDLAKRVNAQGRSMGMALTSCTVPTAGRPTFDLPEDQMELGVGIHGEPGRRRVPLAGAAEIAEQLVDPILADLDFQGGPSIVMLSGLGGTPLIELYLLYGEIAVLLEKAGVQVARTLVGDYITSLDMAGASVTVLKADDELIRLWDAPVKTAGLRWGL